MTRKTAKSKQAPARTARRTSKKQTSRNNKRTTGAKKFWKTFVICLLIELLVAIAAVGFYTYDRVMNYNIGGGDELSGTLSKIVAGESRNIAVFGTDKSGLRSDVIMIMSVYPEKNTLSLLSVPRDTKVKIGNSTYKINAALQIGGEELAVETVMDVLDIPIHDYVVVNFNAVETLIDELGGVQFNVPQRMWYQDPEQDLYIDLQKGDQLLNGKKAVQMLRFREYPMGDLDRNKVQQDFFQAAFSQKFQPQYIAKVPAIYGLINQNMRSNMSLGEILEYLDILSAMGDRTVQTFELPVAIADPYVVMIKEEADVILDEYYR
ncbi:MAG: LCP family protein [Clostridia bacterium]|nr:LCP family protein [Clostridia bacterium]